MSKGFGIAALVIAIIAIFVPVAGIFFSGAACLLAGIAALAGDRAFAVATPLIAGANTFFMSPALWPALSGPDQTAFVTIILVVLALPFLAIALNASGRIVLNKNSST